ncbi:MAG: diguanylate cyclase [Pseudomonadota bacterium]
MTSTIRHGIWVVLILLIGFFFAHEAGHLQAEREVAQQRAEALNVLAIHRAGLEGALNSTLYLTGGLASQIAVDGGISEHRFALLAEDLIGINPYIRNIGLAPGNTIRMVYPLAGNERALGLHYPDHPDQWPAVQRAIEARQPVIAGPIPLVQGGIGIINRIPVFLRSGSQEGTYWGMVSSVIDFDALLGAAGVAGEGSPYQFALIAWNARGEDEPFQWGETALFHGAHVALDVRLPGATWSLGLRPKAGWNSRSGEQTEAFWIGILLTLLIATLVHLLLRKQRAISHLAMHDPLTELLNRRAFDSRLEEAVARQRRHGGSFAVLHFDLDGFKPINDQLGHAAGDEALRIIALRLLDVLRLDDVVARLGGDEFAILVQGTEPSAIPMAESVAEKVLVAIGQPMWLDGQEARLSASIGIAACPEHVCEEGGLMRLADQAMYQAKAGGKGRWVVCAVRGVVAPVGLG